MALHLQLATMIDGWHLVEATYVLEGNGSLVIPYYKNSQALASTFTQRQVPYLREVAQETAE